jgi:hypothetical protein
MIFVKFHQPYVWEGFPHNFTSFWTLSSFMFWTLLSFNMIRFPWFAGSCGVHGWCCVAAGCRTCDEIKNYDEE